MIITVRLNEKETESLNYVLNWYQTQKLYLPYQINKSRLVKTLILKEYMDLKQIDRSSEQKSEN